MRSVLMAGLLLASIATVRADDAPLRVPRAAGPITIDGNLDDPGWKNALKLDTWYETNPGDNVEPKVKTTGWVTYDDKFFYVAIEALDPDPSKIHALFADHDNINGNSDDYAGVILDTRNDGKTGLLLLVTPRGTQYDAVTDDVTGNEDSSPDFFWDSVARITDKGYNVEIRIPYSSLRYKKGNPQTWGMILYRNYPRDRRYQYFTNKLPRGKNCFVCSYGKITGLEGLPEGGHIVAAPYVTAKQNGQTRAGLGTPIANQPVKGDGGLDVKWTPNAVTAVDATINPDFSQVESDVAAISTNQRFAIFYPEKRPFFLEGTELFNTPIQAVYTRTITSPRWGLRSTGKMGDDAYTVLVADDRGGGTVILPSPTGSNFADQDGSAIVGIGRVRHDFGKNSSVSFLGTFRQEHGGAYNRVFGPDFQWRPSAANTITGQFLLSESRTPDRPDLAAQWDGRKLRSHAGDIWWAYSDPKNDFYTEYKDYGDDFRADNGFVPQVGYRSNYAEAGRTFRPTGFFSRVRTFAFAQYDTEQDGSLLYRLFSAGFGTDGKYRSNSRFRLALDKVRSGNELFVRHQFIYSFNFAVNQVISQVTASGTLGQDVDFANNRLGRGADVNVGGTLQPTKHLQIDLRNDVRWLQVHPPQQGAARLFTAQVERVRAQYTFNSRMFVRAVVQHTGTNNNVAFYGGQAVDHHDGSLATQLLFAYKVNWQSVLFVGIGDLREVTADQGNLVPSARQVFMKLSYAFQR
jgi:hypothetical protein